MDVFIDVSTIVVGVSSIGALLFWLTKWVPRAFNRSCLKRAGIDLDPYKGEGVFRGEAVAMVVAEVSDYDYRRSLCHECALFTEDEAIASDRKVVGAGVVEGKGCQVARTTTDEAGLPCKGNARVTHPVFWMTKTKIMEARTSGKNIQLAQFSKGTPWSG